MFGHFLIKMSDLMSKLTHNSIFITLGGDNKTFDRSSIIINLFIISSAVQIYDFHIFIINSSPKRVHIELTE